MPARLFRVARSRTGLGLFATRPIAKGREIVEYCGRRIPSRLAQKRERRRGSKYMFEIDARVTIDGSSRKNLARYANHSCRPNSEAELVRGRMILRALRRIAPGDEITYHYGEEYFALFIAPRGCKCAACVKKKRRGRGSSSRHARFA